MYLTENNLPAEGGEFTSEEFICGYQRSFYVEPFVFLRVSRYSFGKAEQRGEGAIKVQHLWWCLKNRHSVNSSISRSAKFEISFFLDFRWNFYILVLHFIVYLPWKNWRTTTLPFESDFIQMFCLFSQGIGYQISHLRLPYPGSLV